MAQDVIVRGVTYTGVEKLSLPVSGGSALFRDTSDADASASDVLSGKKAYNANGEINGGMTNQGAVSGTISDKDTPFQIPQGYHNGSGSVEIAAAQKALLVPGNIRDSVTILGVTGNYTGGGGGPTSADAILIVTAPSGSTVTATNGGTTLSPTLWTTAADANFECALFVIGSALFDAANPWTVTATLGTDSKSSTVVIDSNKEYDVELPFELWLVRNGVSLVQPITSHMDVVADPDFYILSSTSGASGVGASWLIDVPTLYSSITFVFSKTKSVILSGNSDRCGFGTGLVASGNISTQNATYIAYSAILPLNTDLETRVVSIRNAQTQGNYAQVSVGSGSAAGSRKIAIKDIYLSR